MNYRGKFIFTLDYMFMSCSVFVVSLLFIPNASLSPQTGKEIDVANSINDAGLSSLSVGQSISVFSHTFNTHRNYFVNVHLV